MTASAVASKVSQPLLRTRNRYLSLAISFVVFLVVALYLQHAANAYHAELSVESDDPAHYVTGLMIHDYLRAGFPWPPEKFAENYYAHYPKVAIGHWPPVFYILQGLWMFAAGDSIASDLVLMAVLNALYATVLYWTLCVYMRIKFVAWAAGLLLLLLPVVQVFSSTVMADLPVALFCECAVLCWAVYLEHQRTSALVGFAVLSTLAILTKGNGYALLLVPPVTLALTRRWFMLRDQRLWFCGGSILLICTPWSFLTHDLITPTMQYKLTPTFFVQAVSYYVGHLTIAAGLLIGVLGLLGFGAVVLRLAQGRKFSGFWAALASWIISFVLFHALVPAGLEPRYLLLVFPAWLIFVAKGCFEIAERIQFQTTSLPGRTAVLFAAGCLVFSGLAFSIPRRQSFGFIKLAQDLSTDPRYKEKVVLVSSENDGEGMLIAELAQHDHPRPDRIVLRASRLLATSDWNGKNYSLRYHSTADLLKYLQSIPVGIVVLDRTPGRHPNLHQPLLDAMVRDYPQWWRQSAIYPPGGIAATAINVYELTGSKTLPVKPFKLQLDGTFRKNVTVRP